jgi:hypothetical protein
MVIELQGIGRLADAAVVKGHPIFNTVHNKTKEHYNKI